MAKYNFHRKHKQTAQDKNLAAEVVLHLQKLREDGACIHTYQRIDFKNREEYETFLARKVPLNSCEECQKPVPRLLFFDGGANGGNHRLHLPE